MIVNEFEMTKKKRKERKGEVTKRLLRGGRLCTEKSTAAVANEGSIASHGVQVGTVRAKRRLIWRNAVVHERRKNLDQV